GSPWRRLVGQPPVLWAAGFLLAVLACGLLAPWIMPLDPAAANYARLLEGPSRDHWLGTDEFGRDLATRLIHGAPLSLGIGLVAAAGGAVLGTAFGIASGMAGGWLDRLAMRFCDVLLAFPGLLLALAIVALLGPGLANVGWAVAIASVPVFARLARAATLTQLEAGHVEAARLLGVLPVDIAVRHVLPGAVGGVLAYFWLRAGTAILTAAGLSFLGLGAQPPAPEWGAMLAAGRSYIGVADHLMLVPGLAIFLSVLALTIIGDGVRDALDPRLPPA
ncbi:MAG TPA: ABC transporter permease subunit, partial [Beijerinckiaceae bacterium]|nr:ABC transporter permease subunit [Beijerinckiaceae bacterium]